MLIGLISDTHDNLGMVDRAVGRLNDEDVDLVLHAGDYVSPFVIPRLGRLNAPLIGVLGNNDGDHALLLARFAEADNLELRDRFAAIAAGGTAIGLLHGDQNELLSALIERQVFDVVVHGHTHRAGAHMSEETLVINPGEVCGYLLGEPSIALLETDTRRATIVNLR